MVYHGEERLDDRSEAGGLSDFMTTLRRQLSEWLVILLFLAGLYLVGRAIHLHYGDHALMAWQGLVLLFFGFNGVRHDWGKE